MRWIDVHVRAPGGTSGVNAADAPNDGLAIEGHVLAEWGCFTQQVGGNRACSRHFAQLRRQLGRTDAFNRHDRRWSWNPLQSVDEETLRGEQPIAQRLVCGSRGLIRLPLCEHYAHKEPPARMPSCNCVDCTGIKSMRNPLLLAVIARVLAGRIAHHPQGTNATCFIGMRAAPADAVPAHEHLDRKFHFLPPTDHCNDVLDRFIRATRAYAGRAARAANAGLAPT
jgi:hypothetical protein